MSKVPSLPYTQIVRALQRDGWIVVRQRGSHIRLQKHVGDEVLKLLFQRIFRSNAQLWLIYLSRQD